MPVVSRRSHSNGWVATTLRNEQGLVEGYLWDEHGPSIAVPCEGWDRKKIQEELDRITGDRGHICSDQCEAWTREVSVKPVPLAPASSLGQWCGHLWKY